MKRYYVRQWYNEEKGVSPPKNLPAFVLAGRRVKIQETVFKYQYLKKVFTCHSDPRMFLSRGRISLLSYVPNLKWRLLRHFVPRNDNFLFCRRLGFDLGGRSSIPPKRRRINIKKQVSSIIILMFILLNINVSAQEAQDSTVYYFPPNSEQVIPALNFKDTDLRDVLRALALEYKTNIVVDNKINKRISVALYKLPLLDAIQIIAEDNGLEFSYDKQRFFVKEFIPKPIPPPPTPKEPEAIISYSEETNKLDIIADNVEVKNLVKVLREKTGNNFLITSGTSGRITGTLTDIDFKVGLKNLLQNNGFYFIEKDSIYYISRSSYFSSLNEPSGKTPNGLYWVSVNNNLVSVNVTNANLEKVLDDVSNQLDLQVIKLESPKANVTVKCSEVPVEQALYYLFKGSGFTFKKEKDAYLIGKNDKKNLESTTLVKLNHLRADKVVDQISKQLFPSVTIQTIIEHNGLLLSGPQDELISLEDYISKIDLPVPQVMIEALVIDYNLDNLFEFGLSAGTGDSTAAAKPDKWFPGLDVTASGKKINNLLQGIGDFDLFGQNIDLAKVKLPDNFYANVKFLESNGIANIKSRPILSTLNGHTASLKIGTTQNYVFNEILPVTNQLSSSFIQKETIQKIEANISFEITPWVGPNGELTLEIKPDFETPVGQFSPDKRLIPSINTRSLESTVKLKDGETIILGGLIQENESTSESKIPILGDIPLLGELFKNTSKKKVKAELIIYLTPRNFLRGPIWTVLL